MALRQAGHLDGSIGQNINRVGDDEQNAVEAGLLNLGDNGLKDVYVLVDQVRRVSPGFWAAPAVTTIMAASAASE